MSKIAYDDRIAWTMEIVEDLGEYLPLTLRQIFYQLVARLHIQNTHSQYKALSRALAKARKEGLVPWEVIEDRTRPLYGTVGWDDQREYLESRLDEADELYKRRLMRGQPYYVELFVEKQALITPFARAGERYRLLVNMGRGYSSVTVLKRMADRLLRAENQGYEPLVLAFSDLDPSGVDLVENLRRQFWDFGIEPEVERVALTRSQVEANELPHDPKALKMTDARAGMFIQEYGRHAVELDALSPATLEGLVHEAVERRLDQDLFEREVEMEANERREIGRRLARFL